MPADLIIYAIVAAGLVLWLRGTLGTRQEGDDANLPKNLPDLDGLVSKEDKALTLGLSVQSMAEDQIAIVKNDKSGVIGIDQDTAETGLTHIIEADRNFDLKFFLSAAQDVFVMGVESFAEGDTETLEDILDKPVYESFAAAIKARNPGETMETQIQAIYEARVIEAKLDKKMAYITLRFVADEATLVRSEDGDIISGSLDHAKPMTDIWTFGRDIKSRDPRWFVFETRGGFDDDNDLIPNSD